MIPKRVIVMRADLKASKGKIAVQAAHACEKEAAFTPVSLELYSELASAAAEYRTGNLHKKVCCRVESEAELQAVYDAAMAAGLPVTKVVDFGLTTFKVPTFTCVAIGPVYDHHCSAITDILKLY